MPNPTKLIVRDSVRFVRPPDEWADPGCLVLDGVFDEVSVSLIDPATIEGIAREAGFELDRRRFRANIVIESEEAEPFHEDAWTGGRLTFGDGDDGAIVMVTRRDYRCAMINIDTDTHERDAEVMKTVLRLNEGNAEVYATVVRAGTVRVGDPIHLVDEVVSR